jgi:hypothetical protein
MVKESSYTKIDAEDTRYVPLLTQTGNVFFGFQQFAVRVLHQFGLIMPRAGISVVNASVVPISTGTSRKESVFIENTAGPHLLVALDHVLASHPQ